MSKNTDTMLQLDFNAWAAARYSVTPEQAQHWLDNCNDKNRRIRKLHATNLARQMDEGYWQCDTHEGIAFDTNGELLDGQHRLMAVTLHGRPVEMLIWTGIGPKARTVVGDAARRTAADSLCLVGYDIDRRTASMLNMMKAGRAQFARGQRPSTRELEDFYLKYRDAIEFANTQLPKTKGIPIHASIMAAVGRAYYHINADTLTAFCQCFITAMPAGDRDCNAPLLLRGYVTKNSGKLGGTKERSKLYAITENMIKKFAAGEPVQLVKGQKTELYPLPLKAIDRTPKGAVVLRRRAGETTKVVSGNTDAALERLTAEPRV